MNKTQKSESFVIGIYLAIVGGFLDAYTYCCRDHVFANAQTGNIVRLGITISQGQYILTLRYFIPIVAFCIGVVVALSIKSKNNSKLHWRQIILILEMIIIVIVGFIPIDTITNIIANVLISFLCAMQAESFRKVLGHPFSSTMCTGNLRSGTEYLYQAITHNDYKVIKKAGCYLFIIISFIIGAFLGTHITHIYCEKAIFITLAPLMLSTLNMSYKSINEDILENISKVN